MRACVPDCLPTFLTAYVCVRTCLSTYAGNPARLQRKRVDKRGSDLSCPLPPSDTVCRGRGRQSLTYRVHNPRQTQYAEEEVDRVGPIVFTAPIRQRKRWTESYLSCPQPPSDRGRGGQSITYRVHSPHQTQFQRLQTAPPTPVMQRTSLVRRLLARTLQPLQVHLPVIAQYYTPSPCHRTVSHS